MFIAFGSLMIIHHASGLPCAVPDVADRVDECLLRIHNVPEPVQLSPVPIEPSVAKCLHASRECCECMQNI